MDIEKINKILEINKTHLFVGGELVATEKTSKQIKQYVKNNYEPPKKDIKGFLIRITINNKEKYILNINCVQITLTPKLFIGPKDDDASQTFTYTEEELKKYGFKIKYIKDMMKAIKNNLISFEKSNISITELLDKK